MTEGKRAADVVIRLGLDTLERVIGGDDAVAIEIRNTIVQQFTERHLKALINDKAFDAHVKNIEAGIVTLVNELYGKMEFGRFTLNDKTKQAIKEHVERAVAAEFDTAVRDAVAAAVEKLTPTIEARVSKAVDAEVARRVRLEVGEKLKAAQAALGS